MWRAFWAGAIVTPMGLRYVQTGELLYLIVLLVGAVYMGTLVWKVRKTKIPTMEAMSVHMSGREENGMVVDAKMVEMSGLFPKDDSMGRMPKGNILYKSPLTEGSTRDQKKGNRRDLPNTRPIGPPPDPKPERPPNTDE